MGVHWLRFDWLQNLADRNSPEAALRQKLAQDPLCRFASPAEVAIAGRLGVTIDANRATVDDWLRLPGLSIGQARSLVDLARSGLTFYCLDDVAAALGLTTDRLQPLAPVLSFAYYDPNGNQPPLLSLNTATLAAIAALPGMDPDLAQQILSDRDRRGPYRSLADLQRRLGLASDRLATLMYYIRL